MKLRRKLFAAVSSLAVAAAVLLTGCGAPAQEGTALKETGILTLSVNPEIQIEYNRDGKVTALTGRNDDGKGIVEAYPDYIGKDCEDVLKDLIVEINEAGYFVDDIDGNKKNIVLQLEPGSVLPSDDFLADMSASTQEAVRGLELSSGIVTIDDDDYDPAYAKDGKPSPYITLEKAQEIALAQANVDAADAVFDDKEFDHDDGTPVFELEFMANGNEYEYDIHAVTGKVVKAEHKTAGGGSANYDDTDYGPNNDGVTDYDDTDYGRTATASPTTTTRTTARTTTASPITTIPTTAPTMTASPTTTTRTTAPTMTASPTTATRTTARTTTALLTTADTNYDDHGTTDYGNTNYGDTNYDDGGSDYSDDDDDDGNTDYDD